MKWAIASALVSGFIVGICAWLVLVVESTRAVLCLRPEARQYRFVRWNWFNALPRYELFTPKGMVHRHRAFVALRWFLGALLTCGTLVVTALAVRRYGS